MPHAVAGGYKAAGRQVQAATMPMAVLGAADLLALGALCALHDVGLHVPRDLFVVGFDDIPLAAYATPPLTTVRQPIAALARAAVTLLLDRITADAVARQGDPHARPAARARVDRPAVRGTHAEL